jgi:hypothetical protein
MFLPTLGTLKVGGGGLAKGTPRLHRRPPSFFPGGIFPEGVLENWGLKLGTNYVERREDYALTKSK